MNKVVHIAEDQTYVFECPHCYMQVQVGINEVNCSIFRHAVYKTTGEQVSPHLPEVMCRELMKKGIVYGCAKPFKLSRGISGMVERVEICEYI